MKERIARRLAELREEFEAGQKMLVELDEKRERLKESMLRIAGAVQVLEELGGTEVPGDGHDDQDPAPTKHAPDESRGLPANTRRPPTTGPEER